MQKIIIKKGREKSLQMRHQWLFSGSIERVIPDASDPDARAVRAFPPACP